MERVIVDVESGIRSREPVIFSYNHEVYLSKFSIRRALKTLWNLHKSRLHLRAPRLHLRVWAIRNFTSVTRRSLVRCVIVAISIIFSPYYIWITGLVPFPTSSCAYAQRCFKRARKPVRRLHTARCAKGETLSESEKSLLIKMFEKMVLIAKLR